MLNWISRQQEISVAQFDVDLTNVAPSSTGYLAAATKYVHTISQECNYLDAVKLINWDIYLFKGSKVLDLGCGGGWLTAFLSRFDAVKTIYALDSSKHFLRVLLPEVVSRMDGDVKKVEVIEALFTPLLFDDKVLDVVVASSAVHHADNLESVLKEVSRVLKSNGYFILLNETPRGGFRYFISAVLASMKTLKNIALHKYFPTSPSLSSSGFLYDPRLGDRDYPLWFWIDALKAAEFAVEEVINTALPTVKGSSGRPLIHFICRKI
jgi:ubiquinone/menaquinone biosynthesis C-methylase UbiE